MPKSLQYNKMGGAAVENAAKIGAFVVCALCAFVLLSCGGGGGGGAAAASSSGPWGGKTTITIPFTKGASRAGFSDGVMSLDWDKIDITITQTVNGTSEVVFEESIEEEKNVTLEVVTGSKIEATATIYIPGAAARTAKGGIERVEPGKNTLTVYVPYNLRIEDSISGLGLTNEEYTSGGGLNLPYYYEVEGELRLIEKYERTTASGSVFYDPGVYHDITGDLALKAHPLPLAITMDDGKYYIKKAVAADPSYTSVRIPAKVGDKTIYGVAPNAFSGNDYLTSVTIDNGIKAIGSNAFSSTGLTSLSLPASLTELGESAFQFCGSLGGTITIPGGVSVISNNAFNDCDNLQTVVMQNGVTKIDVNAFSGCGNLSNVVFPDTLRVLEAFGFSDCPSLPATVELPEGLEVIGKLAFWYCSGMQTLIVPSTIKEVDYAFFYNCNSSSVIEFRTPTPPVVAANDPNTYRDLDALELKRGTIRLPNGANTQNWVDAFSTYVTINPDNIEVAP